MLSVHNATYAFPFNWLYFREVISVWKYKILSNIIMLIIREDTLLSSDVDKTIFLLLPSSSKNFS